MSDCPRRWYTKFVTERPVSRPMSYPLLNITPMEDPALSIYEWERLTRLHVERFVAETHSSDFVIRRKTASDWQKLFDAWLTREVAGGNVGNADG